MSAQPDPNIYNHPDPYAPIYVISVAAELSGMHPQTLRQYDRMGLVVPLRPSGGQRRYSPNDVVLLRKIQSLSTTGVSLEGIRRIVDLEQEVTELRDTVVELVEQLHTLQSHTGFSRTFTAGTGASGNVTSSINVPQDREEQAGEETKDDLPKPASRAEAARNQVVRALYYRRQLALTSSETPPQLGSS